MFMGSRLKNIKFICIFLIKINSICLLAHESSCLQSLEETLVTYNSISKCNAQYIRNYRKIKSFRSRLKKTILLLREAENHTGGYSAIGVFYNKLSYEAQEKIPSYGRLAKRIKNLNSSCGEKSFCSKLETYKDLADQLNEDDLIKIVEKDILVGQSDTQSRRRSKGRKHRHRKSRTHSREALPEVEISVRVADRNTSERKIDISKYSCSQNVSDDQCNDSVCGICCSSGIDVNFSLEHNCWYAKKGEILLCGHVICKTCKRKLNPRICPWCREPF
jgi:hypothetical protein